jgi:hypothetical protein
MLSRDNLLSKVVRCNSKTNERNNFVLKEHMK